MYLTWIALSLRNQLPFPAACCNSFAVISVRCTSADGGRRRVAPPCCNTCVSSWANKRWPAVVPGLYLPSPRKISWPWAKACACSSRFIAADSASACTCTLLKSAPKRCSIEARNSPGSGAPAPWLDLILRSTASLARKPIRVSGPAAFAWRSGSASGSSGCRSSSSSVSSRWTPCVVGVGMLRTCSATRSASCS